jgi:hypothetical protein
VLEGGFDQRGKFVHIPLGDIQRMSEYFRRVIIRFFLKQQLINSHLATSPINWKHSGFSVDHSIRIPVFSIRAREALSQYIARPPLSLKKISIEENGEATLISFSSDSEFFKGKTETFTVMRFFLELTQHIPPKGCQYVRRYGLYASRTKGNGRPSPMWCGWPRRGGRSNDCRPIKTCNPTMQRQPIRFLTKKAARPGRDLSPRCTR